MEFCSAVGLTLKEGIEIISQHSDKFILNIKKTNGLNKKFNEKLDEPRILKITKNKKYLNLLVGYF
ncbi:hypothetical protein [Caldisalinibacter kiritimatiensis]|uniref:Uncharacterized protein n=1 Tax=Caldisalinibacter kiritimatiensis TaxID=1304284 RepID=R1CE93_9FIRM|nr:hypothetical protein [Caldisalinibacter kiritimatiensis]EOD00610.1 hypothetical protein L21TH_1324 [Caldisalinibacter kiritimatiensis]